MELFNITTTIIQSARSKSSMIYEIRPVQAVVLLAASLVTFASLVFAVRNIKRDSTSSWSKYLSALGVLVSVLLYCYVADRASIFGKLSKRTDELTFLVWCLFALVFGVASIQDYAPIDSTLGKPHAVHEFELLSRQQTEEWKGWMQIVILLYHYFGMSKVLRIYRIVRLLVGSYLFMTGYGHTIYFLRTSDFSFRRVAAVVTRLNLLALLLPLIMGTTYDLYYFPALSTFWFLVTWLTIPRTAKGATEMQSVVPRILAACLTTELLLAIPRVWTLLGAALRSMRMADINTNELLFRLSLDRYITYVGMLTACVNEQIRRVIRPPTLKCPSQLQLLSRRGLVAALCTLVGYFILTAGLSTKQTANRAHAFTEGIPILMFVLVRNVSPIARRYNSRMFAWFGKYSLETFILQYHIWLAEDTKKLLSWSHSCQSGLGTRSRGIGCWPERAVLSAMFLLASYATGNATSLLSASIIGPKKVRTKVDILPSSGQSDSGIITYVKQFASSFHHIGLKGRLLIFLLLLWLLNAMW